MTRQLTGPIPPVEATIVEVTNNNFEDLVVYWRKGEVDIALGVATGMTTRRFAISPALRGDGLGVSLAIGPRGRRAAVVSTTFDLPSRATASWVVDNKAGLTTVVVR
jgi:hypothetical protein